MHQDYPHMLYLGGKLDAEHVIVADAGEEAHAKAEGFVRFDSKPAKPDNKQDPQDSATSEPAEASAEELANRPTSPAPKRGRPAKAK